jgi:hypothetical protein
VPMSVITTSEQTERLASSSVATKGSSGTSARTAGGGGKQISSRSDPSPISVIHQLLTLLASDSGHDWRAYDQLTGVNWRETEPTANPDVEAAHVSHSRTGAMLILGFSEVELPHLEPEGVLGVRIGNEGECSLSLNGDLGAVHEIAIVKYYPGEDIGRVLNAQLPETVDVALVGADECPGIPPSWWLYTIRFPDGGTVYADIVNEEGGRSGPGFTTFVLTRNDPRTEGLNMRCREEST